MRGTRRAGTGVSLPHERRVRRPEGYYDPRLVAEICGNGRVESAILSDDRTTDRSTVGRDAVLTFLGLKPDLRPARPPSR